MRIKRILALLIGGLTLLGSPAAWADAVVMRISTENSDRHFQTLVVARFAEALAQKAGGRLDVRHSPGARLFKDRDALRALQIDQLEMAVMGTWLIDRLVPEAGLLQLPMFYGRDVEAIRAVIDGEPGRLIGERIAQRLGIRVLGRWLELGHGHIFGHGCLIRSYADLKGLRIRLAGGLANIARIEVLGARPFVIAWPDFPGALALGAVDGAMTSFESVASWQLWDKGLHSAFADRQDFAHYVPLLSEGFWDRLPADLRDLVAEIWDGQVDAGRRLAAEAQEAARAAFVAHGGAVSEPDPEAVRRVRRTLLERQPALVAAIGIDPALVDLATRRLGDDP